MPEHLEDLELSKEAGDFAVKLGVWLAANGIYAATDQMKYFDECVSKGLRKEIRGLGLEVAKLLTTKPKYSGVARPKDQRKGGWLINEEHEQCLVSVRVSDGSEDPYIWDGKVRKPFQPLKAIYCAPNQYAFISGGIEFYCIH